MYKQLSNAKKSQSSENNDAYKNCPQLQQWLQENWLMGSLIIKMIVSKQLDEFTQANAIEDTQAFQ